MTMSRVISLAAGLSLSVLFSTAAVADNGVSGSPEPY